MTHQAAGSSRGVPRIWLLPLVVITTILALTAAGVFRRSLILDLVAWWPVWLTLALAVVLARRRRIGRLRMEGLVPILVTAVLAIFVMAHVDGWPLNPSASRYLVGPAPETYSVANLVASVDGELVVTGGSSFLYEVDPLSRGGRVGVPSSDERTLDGVISVVLITPSDPGLMGVSGWEVSLSAAPSWGLELGGELDLDLTGLRVEELEVSGAGDIALGVTDTASRVTVDGAFAVAVPVGVPVRVLGPARVPGTWQQTTNGWASPVGGIGWVIEVPEDSVVSIDER